MNLQKFKKKHGLTVKDIASIANVTERTVFNWLSGATDMPEAYWFYINAKVKK